MNSEKILTVRFRDFHFIPVDLALLVYLALTFIYLIYGGLTGLKGVMFHCLIRFIITGAILVFAYYDNLFKEKSNLFVFFRNFYPLFLLIFIYKETGYLNNIVFDYFDPFFVRLEENLWHSQPSLAFSGRFPQAWFSELMNLGYFSFYLLVFGFCFYVFINNRSFLQDVISIIIISFLFYYVIFNIFPVKGPQFFFSEEMMTDTTSGIFRQAVRLAQWIGESETGAFPSSHVGTSLIILYLSSKLAKKIFPVILLFSVLLWFGAVYIKAHYLVDIIAGFLTAPLVYQGAHWYNKQLTKGKNRNFIKPAKVKLLRY